MSDDSASTDSVSRSFPMASGGRLEIRSDRGSIAIETTENDQVDLEVRRRVLTGDRDLAAKILAAAALELSTEGSTLRVRSTWASEDDWPGIDVRFTVKVPRRFDLDLATNGGSVTVGDLEGEVAAVTRGGSLSFGRIEGAVRAESSGGNIRLAACTGGARLASHGGSISVRLTATPQRDCRLFSTGGSLEVEVADAVGLDLDAQTVGGHIHSGLRLAAAGGRALSGSVNGGGAKLALRAVGGNISLKRFQSGA